MSGNTAEQAKDVIAAAGTSEKLITAPLSELEQGHIPHYVLQRAKSAHLWWKKRLAEMLIALNSLPAKELTDHHQCRLGKWYAAVEERARRARRNGTGPRTWSCASSIGC